MESEYHSHSSDRRVISTFSGSGAPVPYSSDAADCFNGSQLHFNVSLDDCRYNFYLFGKVVGSGIAYGEPYEGMTAFNQIQGVFDGASLNISRSAQFPVISNSRLLEENPSIYLLEDVRVAKILGEENLGTVTVTWNFTAVE